MRLDRYVDGRKVSKCAVFASRAGNQIMAITVEGQVMLACCDVCRCFGEQFSLDSCRREDVKHYVCFDAPRGRNRYYERISSEESYIVFLRYTDKPSRPWYTLEIEPGGTIRQKRSYSNEQYSDLQEAVPFLKEWQQVVQKRMDEKERKLAVESKEKRNKEFEELTVNGNIIHTGRYAGKLLVDELMKDLMEAAATA